MKRTTELLSRIDLTRLKLFSLNSQSFKVILLKLYFTEDFDRLLGEKPDRLRSLPPYPNTHSTTLKRVAPTYSLTPLPLKPTHQPTPVCRSIRQSEYVHMQPNHLPHPTVQPINSFSLHSPCGQQPAAGLLSPSGCLNSPVAGKMPPVYSSGLPGEYNVGLRGIHELLQDGDTSYDIDTLNPSLTDLQLQGKRVKEPKGRNVFFYASFMPILCKYFTVV